MKNLSKIILYIGVIGLFLNPLAVLAQKEYTLLEPGFVGGAPDADTSVSFVDYAENAYKIFLTIVVFVTVLMFIIGGLEYMTSALPATKSNGIKRITAAFWGLVLALSSVLILNIINPDLLEIRVDFARVATNISEVGENSPDNSVDPIDQDPGNGDPVNTTPGEILNGSIPSTPDCSTNPDCVSLASRGATVANWEGINGPGRTDRVRSEVADATVWVQQDLRTNHNLNTQVTAAHTNGVGHSTDSQHYQGIAIDIQPTGGNVSQENLELIRDSCRRAGFTYTLIENRHVHCDAR